MLGALGRVGWSGVERVGVNRIDYESDWVGWWGGKEWGVGVQLIKGMAYDTSYSMYLFRAMAITQRNHNA